MADFRKITVLAALCVLLGLTGTASAQIASGAFTCVANAAVPGLTMNKLMIGRAKM